MIYQTNFRKILEIINVGVGIFLLMMGTIIIYVGHYFSKKIGIVHVVIYFMASFVILAGAIVLLLYDKPSIF